MSRLLTEEEVALAQTTALQPWVQPTAIQSVPTDEEMQNWYPDPDPIKRRWKTEINVQTGERKHIELSLDEYRLRHIAKIKSRNAWFLRNQEEIRQAKRKALLEALIDQLEKDAI